VKIEELKDLNFNVGPVRVKPALLIIRARASDTVAHSRR